MEDYKRAFAQPRGASRGLGRGSLRSARDDREGKATVLLGLSGQPGTFTEPMVRAMCDNIERPVIFPLSNPTSVVRGTPEDLLAWSHGRAIVATGSPFDSRARRRQGRTAIGQGNNAFIFPGLGFGAILAEASEITDGMVLAASYALADYVAAKYLAQGLIYPPVEEMSEVARRVATRVLQQAFDEGVACTRKTTRDGAEAYVRAKFWRPAYLPFVKAATIPRKLYTRPQPEVRALDDTS